MLNGKKRFHWRSYISFALAITFLIIAVTGIILYIAPPGRVARWISWIMLGMSRTQWEAQHTLFSYLFILLAVVHLFFMNWRLFITYLRKKIGKRKSYLKEVMAATGSILILFFLTLFDIPPAVSVMNLGSNISDTWGEKISLPPVSRTEEMTLNEIAVTLIFTTPDVLVKKIRSVGFEVKGGDQTLNDVADSNGVSPATVFDAIELGYSVFRLEEN